MAHDHAKKKKSAAPKKRSGGSGTPNWAWLLTGLVLGAFIMFLAYLSGLSPQKPLELPTITGKKTPAGNTPPPVQEKPTFEFYDSLKKNEIIPPGEKAPAPETAAPPSPPPAVAATTTTASSATTATNSSKPAYILQVASLPKEADADALKAKLILDGLDAQVQPFSNKGDTWYRVVVGPITDPDKLSQAKATLALQNLTPLVLQKKPAAPTN